MIGFSEYEKIKVNTILGRYLPPEPVYHFLKSLKNVRALEVSGYSVEEREIYSLRMGNGPIRIMLWSQMHGNESTTTKALLDLIQECQRNPPKWLEEVSLLLVPLLNPDGAKRYTRQNANGVDLNRDAQALSQPESQVLKKLFDSFDPHYCFNLHDQRTIYGIGTPPKAATLSFLAPAADTRRGFSDTRRMAASLIGLMAERTNMEIGIGRYDDTFNLNCVGDTFQAAGVPTLLLEAGHYPGDYEREITRFFVYRSLRTAVKIIVSGLHKVTPLSKYHKIPKNTTPFVDIIVKNAQVLLPNLTARDQLGLQFEEVLVENTIHFRPKLTQKGQLYGIWGHRVLDALKRDDLDQLSGLNFSPQP